jgi:transglutaminase-like putative cysteine protease
MLSDRFNTVAHLAVAASIGCYALAEPAPAMALLATPVLALSWLNGRRARPWALPRTATSVLVLLGVLWAVLQTAAGRATPVSTLSQFLAYIVLVKAFDRRTARDDAQFLSLSVFIVIGALLTDNSLPVGVLLLAYSLLGAGAAMLHQVRAGVQRTAEARNAALGAAAPTPAPAARGSARAGVHLAVLTLVALALASGLALVGFLVTPRGYAQGALGPLGVVGAPQVGFSDQVRLGQAGLLSEDTTPVMDVLLTDSTGQALGGEGVPLYLRGSVLDRYSAETGAWTASIPPGAPEFRGRQSRSGEWLRLFPSSHRYELQVTMRGASPGYLFSLWAPVSVLPPRAGVLQEPSRDLALRFRAPPEATRAGRIAYSVRTNPDLVLGSRRAGARDGGGFASGPIHDLGARILAERGLPVEAAARTAAENRAAAAAIQSHLRQGYAYTREMVAPPAGTDPIAMFLFSTRRGHCEYFASAMVALCRSVGLDARVVTGYLAAEFNPMTGQYLVRQSNAHAWAEVALGDGRWQVMDPSPPAAIDGLRPSHAGLLGRLRVLYDAIDFAWNSTVISFDERRRSDLLGSMFGRRTTAGGVLTSVRRAARDLLSHPLPGPLRSLHPAVQWTIAIGAVALPLLLLRRRLARLGRRGSRRRGRAAIDPALAPLLRETGFYPRVLSLLDRARLGKPRTRPPLAHARVLAGTHPAAAGLVAEASELYYRVRFGARPLSVDEAARAARLPDDLARILASAPARSAPVHHR